MCINLFIKAVLPASRCNLKLCKSDSSLHVKSLCGASVVSLFSQLVSFKWKSSFITDLIVATATLVMVGVIALMQNYCQNKGKSIFLFRVYILWLYIELNANDSMLTCLSLPDPHPCPIHIAHVRDGPPYWTTPYGNSNRTLDTVAFGKAQKENRERWVIVITTWLHYYLTTLFIGFFYLGLSTLSE